MLKKIKNYFVFFNINFSFGRDKFYMFVYCDGFGLIFFGVKYYQESYCFRGDIGFIFLLINWEFKFNLWYRLFLYDVFFGSVEII